MCECVYTCVYTQALLEVTIPDISHPPHNHNHHHQGHHHRHTHHNNAPQEWSLRRSLLWRLFRFTMVFEKYQGMERFWKDLERNVPRIDNNTRLISLDHGEASQGVVAQDVSNRGDRA